MAPPPDHLERGNHPPAVPPQRQEGGHAAPTAKKPRAARFKSAHRDPAPKKKTVPKKKAARATKEKDFEVFIGRGKNLFSYKKSYNEKWVEWRNTRYQLTQTVRGRFAKNPEARDRLQRYDEAWTRAEPVCQT